MFLLVYAVLLMSPDCVVAGICSALDVSRVCCCWYMLCSCCLQSVLLLIHVVFLLSPEYVVVNTFRVLVVSRVCCC